MPSLQEVVRRLGAAIDALNQWGKVEVTETNYINKAYRNIYEAYYMLKKIEKQLRIPEHEKKSILDKLKSAGEKIRKAIEELRKGKTNPADLLITSGRKDLLRAQAELLATQIREVKEKLETALKTLRKLKEA